MNEARIDLCEESQPLADAAIDALAQNLRLREHPALARLIAWLDEDGRMTDCACEQSTWIHAPTLSELVARAFESFEGRETHDAILQHLDVELGKALAGDSEYWGDEYRVPIIAHLQHADGRHALMCYELLDYLTGPYLWHGLFRDAASVDTWLREQGRIRTRAQYEDISQHEVLTAWGRRY